MTDNPRQVVTYVPERDDEAQARSARAAAAEDVAVAAAKAVAAGAAIKTALQAGETAAAMLDAAREAAVAVVYAAEQTARAAADVAARNITEVAREAAATAAAMVTAAEDAAQEVVAAAEQMTAEASPTVVALDITDRAAATAEAMVAAATAAAVRAAERSRHDTDVAADVAAHAIADIVSAAATTAAAMVAAAATTASAVASRAAERARHEAHIQSQADLLNAVFDGITDSVEVVGETGKLLMHNRAATALGVLHGRTVDEPREELGLFRPDGITEFPAPDTPVIRALAGESSDEVVMLSRNAAHPYGVLLAVSGRPLKDATGRPGAVVVSRDITVQHAQRTELETFAAVAAHDLRTPLAIVTGYLGIIADLAVPELTGETADTVADMLRRAQGGTLRMGSLIDDLLRYATRDAALVVEDVDLRAQVDEVIARHTEHLTPGTPHPSIFVGTLPWVHGDLTRITQVLDNLIGNALKYTSPGQPAHLDITAHPNSAKPDAPSRVHVQIADRGIGIPPGQHSAIFTSFHRIHTTGPYGGTGLGLAICHRIIERHGGHIYATDNPGGGTRMHFTLPGLLPSDPSGPVSPTG